MIRTTILICEVAIIIKDLDLLACIIAVWGLIRDGSRVVIGITVAIVIIEAALVFTPILVSFYVLKLIVVAGHVKRRKKLGKVLVG
jgi:hypothetical protein